MSAEARCSGCGELRPCKPWGGKPWCVDCFPAAASKAGDLFFMGEQEDPELQVWIGRGLHVYGLGGRVLEVAPREPHPRPGLSPDPAAGLWVTQSDGDMAKCGCGKCFYGPCLAPVAVLRRLA